ncbi:MAG TPA: SDR family NAD(P)-dependent oxidoreductase [Polyangiaceae bacterium]|nr:SDR family NAD(P)-dependent oxidoreductase [Polyangiaceae bacterium]
MNIENAVVLVTGANRGLGRAIVAAVLRRGARRVYAGARDPSKLDSVVQLSPERVRPLPLDIASAESLAAAALAAPDVEVLFNNAGVLASYDVITSSREEIAQDFAINFFGLVDTTKAFLPALERAGSAGGAALVNVLSVVSLASVPELGAYSASKAAAFSITQALRGRLLKKGVSVHGAFPGPIDTDMVRAMEMKKTDADEVARAIVLGVEQGVEDISPDPVGQGALATWRRDPKLLERQFASMFG